MASQTKTGGAKKSPGPTPSRVDPRVAAEQERQRALHAEALARAQAQRPTSPATGAPPASAQPATIQVTPPPPPPLDPFFSPDDVRSMGDWMRNVNDTRTTVDSGLSTGRSDTTYQTGQLNQQAKQTASQAQDNMIGRGLFQSSVKDASLIDIEAQRATQEGYLNDRLTQITRDHDSWVSKYGGKMSDGRVIAGTEDEAKTSGAPLGTAVAAWYQEWAGKAAQNATEASANRPLPTAITVPNPDFHPPAAPAAATPGVALPATAAAAAPAKGLGQVPLGAGTGTPDPNRPNVATGVGAIPAKPKKKNYLSGARTP